MTVKAGGTFVESLRNTLGDLAQIATMPDADLQFIVQLQGIITQFIRQQAMATLGPPGGAPGGAPGGEAGAQAGGAPSQPGLGPPPAPQGIAPGGGAGMAGMGTPNPDELRRVMETANGAGG